MVYDRFDQKVMQLGVKDETGQDSQHFAEPGGIAVDAKLNIYVADTNNCRVQKFNKYGVYQMTIGSQMCGPDGFDSLGRPMDVAVDAKGRIYVADEWHVRTQVFDKTGAYLTTIGGNWGSGTSQFRSASGVAVDKKGNVYIADWSTAPGEEVPAQGSRLLRPTDPQRLWQPLDQRGDGSRDV
jgi:sugar lactone lactonase YvrE